MATDGVDGGLAENDRVAGGRGDAEEATVFAGTRSHAAPTPGRGTAQFGAHRMGGRVQEDEHRVGPGIGVEGS